MEVEDRKYVSDTELCAPREVVGIAVQLAGPMQKAPLAG